MILIFENFLKVRILFFIFINEDEDIKEKKSLIDDLVLVNTVKGVTIFINSIKSNVIPIQRKDTNTN